MEIEGWGEERVGSEGWGVKGWGEKGGERRVRGRQDRRTNDLVPSLEARRSEIELSWGHS